jgi:hypothetical protein
MVVAHKFSLTCHICCLCVISKDFIYSFVFCPRKNRILGKVCLRIIFITLIREANYEYIEYLKWSVLHFKCPLKCNISFKLCPTHNCQMVYFQTRNPNLGKFCRVLQWEILAYFIAIWSIFRPYRNMFYSTFAFFWYIVPQKSGNTGLKKSHLFECLI